MHKSSTKAAWRHALTGMLTLCFSMPVAHAQAAEGQNPPANKNISRDALIGLARQFVDSMEAGFSVADKETPPEQGMPLTQEALIKRSFDSLLDGEVLLLNVTLFNGTRRDTLYLKDPIFSIKEKQDVMVSLSDFVTAANFHINIDADAGKASGWFIRESQGFMLDVKGGSVISKDRQFVIQSGDVQIEDGDILVKGGFLEQIFDFSMSVNPGRQEMKIATDQKWPVEEKLERDKRSKIARGSLPPPELPRLDDPLANISVPNIDIISTDRYRHEPDRDPKGIYASRYTAKSSGDLLGHTAETFVSGSNEKRIEGVRFLMTKNSENPDLLGPLKARTYSFVDVTTAQVPHAGSSDVETGFQMSNKDPFVTYDTVTNISGESIPGWDVELYRGDHYLMSADVSDDGRYEFEDVVLYNGINRLRVVQYSDFGEIKEEDKTLFVGPRTFNNEKGAYDVSLTFQDTQTYRSEPSADNDRWQPHLSATYDYQLSNDLALRGGVKARQEDGKERVYLQAGTVQTLGKTILNQDVVANNEGAYTGVLTARHNLNRHNLFGSVKYESEDYNPGSDSNQASQFEVDAAARGPLPNLMGERNQYSADYNYQVFGDGNKQEKVGASYSAKLGKIFAQDRVSKLVLESPSGDQAKFIDNNMTFRGSALGLGWRASMDYNVHPEKAIQAYNFELDKRFNDNFSGQFALEHQPPSKYTIGELSASYRAAHAVLRPSISYDSNNELEVALRTGTSLAYNPYDNDIKLVNKSISDKGGVSAFVYLDKNGNMTFDGDDIAIEGAVVRALHSRREAETNAEGEAFIYDIPAYLVTDVTVMEGSFFEPGWILAEPGVSVRPQKGHISRIEFPIHNSGEVDGTIYGQNDQGENRVLRNLLLRLVNEKGRVVQSTTTANDGFYLFSKIPPGRYFIVPDPEDLKNFHVSAIIPKPIEFSYDGGILYGNNIVFPAGPEFGFDVVSADALKASYPDAAMPVTGRVVLNLGTFNAPLTMAVTWYKLKLRYNSILGGMRPLLDNQSLAADAESGLYTLRLVLPAPDINDAFRRCRALAARDIFCTVEHIPGSGLSSAQADVPPKG